jgi:glucose dehydrogenase
MHAPIHTMLRDILAKPDEGKSMRLTIPAVLIAAALLTACQKQAPVPTEKVTASEPEAAAAVDAVRLVSADSDGANWMNYGRTYSEQRHSPLTQVNNESVSNPYRSPRVRKREQVLPSPHTSQPQDLQ